MLMLLIKSSSTESDKLRELVLATEQPIDGGGFHLDDDAEFPPVTQKTE
jgi:hypothetical protein